MCCGSCHEIERIMHHYLTYILERNLKSIDFLHRLRHEAELFVEMLRLKHDAHPGVVV